MPAADHPDAALVARIRAGDHAAFEAVFRAHFPRLCSFAVGLVGSRAAAEDVVQEVFRRIWEAHERWDVRDTVKTYLYRAVRNQAFNDLRHRQVLERAEHDPDAVERVAGLSQGPEGAESRLEAEELSAVIARVVDELPERCRQVFLLKWQGNLSYAEIAGVMGISVKTVENQMLKALRTIRPRVQAYVV